MKTFRAWADMWFILVPIWMLIVFCYDCTHPEIWCDWKHDPRWYWPLAVVFIPTLLWMTARGHWKSRRGIRNDRLNAMLKVIYHLYKAGRREEADEAYSLYDRFKTAGSESEEEKLANQFSDLYCL